MSGEPQLFRIDPQNHQPDRIEEVDFAGLGFRERRDIQEWVAANPSILSDDLLIVGKEFSGFDRTGERLDLLAVDSDGKLVIIELKRDDTGADAHWQAIKYASYFQRASDDDIVGMAMELWNVSQGEAVAQLLQHLGADDLNALNHDQRIILASHRFAPEVTSAALWLNQKTPDLITCVKLTPYQDRQTETLYVQASTIIPLPEMEEYLVGIGPSSGRSPQQDNGSLSSFAEKLTASFARSKGHETSPFVRRASRMAIDGLPPEIKPDKTGKWAGNGGNRRYYHIWYSRPPWGNWKVNYSVDLKPNEEQGKWLADILFENREGLSLPALDSIDLGSLNARRNTNSHGSFIYSTTGPALLDDAFASQIAQTLRQFIELITPVVDDYGNEGGEDEED